eukprot:TRINITY_DN3989_c0_g1_i2.p1 TRINITY_DN3989_c0_g1~~TRINITY_DN3989_c0_g1_i2.p1  ORF type:complete len:209 (+),score=46.85 TRINITY_DN3989_c0_g1_i2:210-836(+)
MGAAHAREVSPSEPNEPPSVSHGHEGEHSAAAAAPSSTANPSNTLSRTDEQESAKCCDGDHSKASSIPELTPIYDEDDPSAMLCRVCHLRADDDDGLLILNCACTKSIAITHADCAVLWFSFKGNRTCEICHKDVTNLPPLIDADKLRKSKGAVRRQDGAAADHRQQAQDDNDAQGGSPRVIMLLFLSCLVFGLDSCLVSSSSADEDP